MADNIKSYRKKGSKKNFYMFKAYLGTDRMTGKRIETTRRGFSSKTEAKHALERLKVDYSINGWHNEKHPEIKTYDDLFEMWFKVHEKTIKGPTAGNQHGLYESNAQKYFGNVRLEYLTPVLFQDFFSEFSKTHSSIKLLASLLRSPIKYGIRLGILEKDPFNGVVLPRGKKSQFVDTENFYTKDELSYFLKCCKEMSYKIYVYFRLLAYTGMRRSEVLALNWEDVDIENKIVKVTKTVAYDTKIHKLLVQDAKTANSIRTLSLDQGTIDVLKEWHLILAKENFALGKGSTELLFPNKFNALLSPCSVNRWLRKVYKKYPQKQIRVHGFRHTHASLLFEAGASIKEVQVRLGHRNASTTMNVYAHVLKSRSNKTGDRFANYMEK